ncbi:MAG TPA: transposase [Saprospiraceae bacterium]|nr:transposase [Saprospiraceae bacterium]
MSTHTQIIYQIVYSTKNRERCMMKKPRERIFKYISGLLANKNCHLYSVNGVEDHLHIVTHIHPMIALAPLIKDIKISCNSFINQEELIPNFNGWQDGYGAFTYSYDAVPNLVRYVQNQEAHHGSISFEEEYRGLLEEHGVEYDEKYLF